MSDSIKKWHEMQEEEKISKLITEELIDERLEEKGVKYDIDHDEALSIIKDHYEFKLTDNWNETPCYSIYTESTADGYEVWVATHGDGRNVSIYVDDLDSYYVQDAVMEVYESYVNDMKEEVEHELIEEGYEQPKQN